jgi:hypothetical protein
MDTTLSPSRLETVTRAGTLYQTMSTEEQNAFLMLCGLIRADAVQHTGTGNVVLPLGYAPATCGAQHEVNRLVVSPASPGRKGRLRAHEALRLVHDDNTISETHKGSAMVVASAVPRTNDDTRVWFQSLTGSDDPAATLSKDAFRNMYLSLDTFGVPPRTKWLDEHIAGVSSSGDQLTFDEFCRLVAPLVAY